MPTDRARLVVALDDDTHDRWRAFADAHGVTLAALLEALGRLLDLERPSPIFRQAITDARMIQSQRKDRRTVGSA